LGNIVSERKIGEKEYFGEPGKLISEKQAKETLKKEANQKLVESVSLLRSFFNSPGAMRGVVEVEGNDIRHIADNSITAEFFGRTQESMKNMLASEMGVEHDFIDIWIKHYEKSKRTKKQVNFEYEHKTDKQRHFFSVTVNYLGESARGFSKYTYVLFDITDHKQAQEALQKAHDELDKRVEKRTAELAQSNEQLKQEIEERRLAEAALRHERDRAQGYLDTVEAIIVALNADGRITLINQKGCRLFGCGEDELIGQHWFSTCLPQPDGMESVYPVFLKLIAGEEKAVEYFENPIITKKGELRQIAWHNKLLRNQQGRVIGTLSSGEDVTERKRIEMALKSEKEHLAVTLRSIGDAVIATDRQGNITLLNHVAEKLTGWHESDAVGRPLPEVFNIVDEMTREPRQNPVQEVIRTGKIIVLTHHTILICRDGTERIISNSGAPILDIEQRIIGVVLVFRDITDARRMEAELLKMEKLKSLGVLAGGIAHDFNNFLTGIIGNLSLAKPDVRPTEEICQRLEEMEKAALRAKDLTQQLLTFSKDGEPVKQLTQLDILVRDAALFAVRGSNVRCQFDLPADLWHAQVDEGQIAHYYSLNICSD
jgi:PAS domain S-box-containing protein